MQTLEIAEQRLRAAVETEQYDSLLEAAGEYRAAFDATWNAMSEAERRTSELPERSSILMSWGVSMLTLFRTAMFAQRRSLRAAGRYLQVGHERQSRTWGVAG